MNLQFFKEIINNDEIKYFGNMKWNIKYSINMMQVEKDEYYKVENIKYNIFSFVQNKDVCIHCGYGNDVGIVFKFKNGDYGFLTFFESCLTYNSLESDCTLEISNNFNDLFKFCLTDKDRYLYLTDNKFQILKNFEDYLISDLIQIISKYIFYQHYL